VSDVKKIFQSELAFDFAAEVPCEATLIAELEFEYARTIWSDAKPTAQFEERFFRYLVPVAERDTEMKTSSGAPAAIWFASANDPPDFTGATGIPVLREKAERSAVASME
jgi:hypothetical protein